MFPFLIPVYHVLFFLFFFGVLVLSSAYLSKKHSSLCGHSVESKFEETTGDEQKSERKIGGTLSVDASRAKIGCCCSCDVAISSLSAGTRFYLPGPEANGVSPDIVPSAVMIFRL